MISGVGVGDVPFSALGRRLGARHTRRAGYVAFLKEDKCEENLYFGEGTLEIWLNWEKIGKDSFDDLKHGCLSWI